MDRDKGLAVLTSRQQEWETHQDPMARRAMLETWIVELVMYADAGLISDPQAIRLCQLSDLNLSRPLTADETAEWVAALVPLYQRLDEIQQQQEPPPHTLN